MPIFRPLCGKNAGQILAHVASKARTKTASSYTIRMKNNATPELVRLYTRHDSNKKNAASQKKLTRPPHPIFQAAHDQQKQTISARISALAEILISKEKDIHLNAHWNNESEVKDKTKIAEEKMYQGWSL